MDEDHKGNLKYHYDKLSDYDYMIVDQTQGDGPHLYSLCLIPITNTKGCNWQITLAKFKTNEWGSDYPSFEREVWSTQVCSTYEPAMQLPLRIVSILQNCELDYPVELAYQFGGTAFPS